MAYDSIHDKTILFGGWDGSRDDETWVLRFCDYQQTGRFDSKIISLDGNHKFFGEISTTGKFNVHDNIIKINEEHLPYQFSGIWMYGVRAENSESSEIYNNKLIGGKASISFEHEVYSIKVYNNFFSNSEFGIVVNESGKLYIFDYDNNSETIEDRSNITANNTDYKFKFLVNSGAEFEMRNSELSECGHIWGEDGSAGLTIKTNNTVIENSSFYNNCYGIYLRDSSENLITNNNISKCNVK